MRNNNIMWGNKKDEIKKFQETASLRKEYVGLLKTTAILLKDKNCPDEDIFNKAERSAEIYEYVSEIEKDISDKEH